MSEHARSLAALSFLTAVPVARGTVLGTPDLRRAAVLFPVVGGAVGAFVATIVWGAAHLVPPFAAAVLGVASGVAATAALHLDGLGDVADGVGASLGGREPAEAMRDPRLGTFGVAAVALDLLLKAAVLSALVEAGFPWPVVAAGAISRVAPIAIAWRLPYRGGGTGTWTDGIGSGCGGVRIHRRTGDRDPVRRVRDAGDGGRGRRRRDRARLVVGSATRRHDGRRVRSLHRARGDVRAAGRPRRRLSRREWREFEARVYAADGIGGVRKLIGSLVIALVAVACGEAAATPPPGPDSAEPAHPTVPEPVPCRSRPGPCPR